MLLAVRTRLTTNQSIVDTFSTIRLNQIQSLRWEINIRGIYAYAFRCYPIQSDGFHFNLMQSPYLSVVGISLKSENQTVTNCELTLRFAHWHNSSLMSCCSILLPCLHPVDFCSLESHSDGAEAYMYILDWSVNGKKPQLSHIDWWYLRSLNETFTQILSFTIPKCKLHCHI